MKPIHAALAGAIAVLTPIAAHAQTTTPGATMPGSTTPPAAMPPATTTAPSTTPPADTMAMPQDGTPPVSNPASPPPAAAATTAPTEGTTVYGSDGAPVGKITSVAGGNAVVDTGTRKATLALNAFGSGPQGPTITVTKAQLEDAVAKATPPAPAAAEPEKPGKSKKKKSG